MGKSAKVGKSDRLALGYTLVCQEFNLRSGGVLTAAGRHSERMNVAFSDRQWDRLLTEIRDHQVIPVLGRELLVLDLPDGRIPLYHYLARKLIERLNLDLPNANPELEEVVTFFLADSKRDPEDLHFEIRDILTRSQLPVPAALSKLARITDFDLYLSTTFDTLLEHAINTVRKPAPAPPLQALACSRKSKLVDLPDDYTPRSGPAAFQVFGKIGPVNDYALREEDILQFSQRLLTRDLRPQNLFDQLRTRNLLLLGCSFSGWLTRFLLAAAKGDQLYTEGARGLLADSLSPSDRSLVMFLERRKTLVYSEGDALQFVDELFRRWSGQIQPDGALNGAEPALPSFDAGSIFLSYASEDREAARSVAAALGEANLDVWFDQRSLEPGDLFKEKILRNIDECAFFMPVISRHTVTIDPRFFRLEWNRAVERSSYFPSEYPFIQPVVVDQTPADADFIPPKFRERHWLRLDSGRLPEDFVLQARKLIRGRRREAVPG